MSTVTPGAAPLGAVSFMPPDSSIAPQAPRPRQPERRSKLPQMDIPSAAPYLCDPKLIKLGLTTWPALGLGDTRLS